MHRLFLLLLPLVIYCSACGPIVLFAEDKNFAEASWSYTDTARFDFAIPATETAYNFYLTVEHDADFAYQNFYVLLHTGFPNGKRQSQQLSLQLAGDFGAWKGDCSRSTCSQEILFLRKARFEQVGDYYLTVAQHSREEPLRGIQSIGFTVTEAGE